MPAGDYHEGMQPRAETIELTPEVTNAIQTLTIKATAKQKKAIEILAESIRLNQNKTKGEILLEAGYSKEMSKRPSAVLNCVAVREAIAQMMPKEKLASTHNKLLNRKTLSFIPFGTDTTDEAIKDIIKEMGGDVKFIQTVEVKGVKNRQAVCLFLDADVALKSLDMAYKLFGSYAPVQNENTNMNINLVDLFEASMKRRAEKDIL